ncbi:hypothetical protein GCK72_024008 [Caenorhabditis remanei]|uniref:Uncharacterized protein n=1 Tax=Caenorhabditis remanei TaxID=31234 RepID=A0A6A5FYA5_CAERE|nr:hypothetical protein GCK72_024008 [Caenorhabditis remanei]KAF1747543.1 hypothetical protein GCK72_024008 [Caenorhabditis remanei]
MTDKSPDCLSCYVSQLEMAANNVGYTLQPLIPIRVNLPPQYHPFFVRLHMNFLSLQIDRKWESLPEIDRIPYTIAIFAILDDLEQLLDIGMKPNTENGVQRVIKLMRRIKNLISLMTSVADDSNFKF